ncbi:Sodium/hydrogen exchanger [Apiospora marii]|uniref:Sodium/hydrogen exchanger n=1 Tax=Apiospora marii TaxID=335849 RepID=A0ABR1R336_9PEZI
MTAASLAYHEPGLEDILVLAAFLLALNLVNAVLDRTLYCGLVGQVFVGVAWGTPGAGWLSGAAERAVVQLGYLGLVLVVFEGGAASSLPTMRANLALASGVALTGVAAPMGLSFLLGSLAGAGPLQAFAAGAALCSTSLGTTFTVLSTSGLASTQLGSVLSTAAMMDDVVGLVMVQIVSAGLGSGGSGGTGDIAPAIVVRPVLVSVAFAVVVPLACRFVLRPLMAYVWRKKKTMAAVKHSAEQEQQSPVLSRLLQAGQSAFLVQTGVLLGLVAAAGYAGASVLLAAYLAGIVASWWRDERAALLASSSDLESPTGSAAPAADSSNNDSRDMYSTYYGDSVERILKPFFFASIGFSIPITRMFSGPVVWRGIIYAILMALGKTLCGAWLIRFPVSARGLFGGIRSTASRTARILLQSIKPGALVHQTQQKPGEGEESRIQVGREPCTEPTLSGGQANEVANRHTAAVAAAATTASRPPASQTQKSSSQPRNPLSLYPAGIVSCAMVARGEIGFLISSVAETKGIFRSSSSPITSSTPGEEPSEIFLIVTWSIVLCTILGPLCVGLLVRRVKRLESRDRDRDRDRAPGQVEGGRKNVLGVWGVT